VNDFHVDAKPKPKRGKQWIVNLLAVLLLVLLAVLVVKFHDQSYQLSGSLFSSESGYRMLRRMEIWHVQTRRRQPVSETLGRSLNAVMERRLTYVKQLEITVGDVDDKALLTTDEDSLFYSLDIHFDSGIILRTRSQRTTGPRFAADLARNLDRGIEQYKRMIREGVIDFESRGRIINI
jgi:hypothetical protein